MAVSRCPECGRLVIRLSWSQLRTAEECKQKRYLRVQGRGKKVMDQRVFFPGNVTDRVVRDWLRQDPKNNVGGMPDMVRATMERVYEETREEGGRIVKKHDFGDMKRVEEDCTKAVERIEPSLLKYVVPFNYEVDYRFEAPLILPRNDGTKESIFLIGGMDIFVTDNAGQFWVFDVKHTRDAQYWRKTIGQLTFYDLAIFLLHGKYTAGTALFQPLVGRREHPHRVSDEDRAQMNQRIVGVVNDIWTNDNTPRSDTKYCGRCDVKHACEKYKPVKMGNTKRVSFAR